MNGPRTSGANLKWIPTLFIGGSVLLGQVAYEMGLWLTVPLQCDGVGVNSNLCDGLLGSCIRIPFCGRDTKTTTTDTEGRSSQGERQE